MGQQSLPWHGSQGTGKTRQYFYEGGRSVHKKSQIEIFSPVTEIRRRVRTVEVHSSYRVYLGAAAER